MIEINNGWGVYSDEGNVRHVIPENDISEHSHDLNFPIEPSDNFKDNIENGLLIIDKYIQFTPSCKCSPKIEYLSEECVWLIIHNSFDGRENFESNNKVRLN